MGQKFLFCQSNWCYNNVCTTKAKEDWRSMTKLTFTNHAKSTTTVLENEFIDQHMAKANGEYVKVYLLLLRHLHTPSGTLTISEIADKLECTEKDVDRALNYWKSQGLLDYASVTDQKEAPAKEAPAPVKKESLKKEVLSKEYKMLKDSLSKFFRTKVQFTCSEKGKGKISIPFSNEEELEHIVELFDRLKN